MNIIKRGRFSVFNFMLARVLEPKADQTLIAIRSLGQGLRQTDSSLTEPTEQSGEGKGGDKDDEASEDDAGPC